ncbi:unnamed protein product [Camellia sinensis]
MPSIISNELNDTKSIKISDIRSNGDSTLRKRRLRSDSAAEDGTKSKSPRRCINGGLNCTENGIIEKESGDNKVVKSRELLVKKLSDDFIDKPKWNPRGTGKSLLMERVKDSLVDWAQGAGFQPPDVLAINCTSLTNTSEIFSKALPYIVFQPQALELCARKVAAASGDMRKALCICRSAIEMLQAELSESACNLDFSLAENGVDHMAIALSKTYRSPIMDTVQSLPQHQQIMLCSAVKLFRGGKKDTTIGE